MAVTERTRHELHENLVELMGPDQAEILMESLPPVGWGDVVTKEHLDLRLERLESRLTTAMDSKLRQANLTFTAMLIIQTAILVTLILALR